MTKTQKQMYEMFKLLEEELNNMEWEDIISEDQHRSLYDRLETISNKCIYDWINKDFREKMNEWLQLKEY